MKSNHTGFIGNQTSLKVKPHFPRGFKSERRKSPQVAPPSARFVITENLFTKLSEFIFQEFKTYFIGSSGHWKILYSFPSDLAHYFGTYGEFTHLANHLNFPDAQKEVSKPRNILDAELCSLCPDLSGMKTTTDIWRWRDGAEDKWGKRKETRGSMRKENEIRKYSFGQNSVKSKTYLSELYLISLMFILR